MRRLWPKPSAGSRPCPRSATPQPQGAIYTGGAKRSDKPFEQTHLMLAFEAPPYRHPDYFAAQILAGALGGGMSSRLFQEVRERRGLCYSVYAFSTGLTDSGMFVIHAAGAPDRADELFAVIRDELERAADQGFDDAEIARVKAQLKMGLLDGPREFVRPRRAARPADPHSWPGVADRGADRENRGGRGRRSASHG